MTSFVRHLGQLLRGLGRSPGFALTAIGTLALGIGASTAIFSVVNAVLLRPLPYEDPESLYLVWGDMRNRAVYDFPFPPADFHDLRETVTAFEDVGAVTTFRNTFREPQGEPQPITGAAVTTNFFSLLGANIALGRNFSAADGTPPAPPEEGQPPGPPVPGVLILSHEFWQRTYGGDPSIVGRTVEFGGQPTQVVGVLAPGFEVLYPPGSDIERSPDAYTAIRLDFAGGSRINVFLRVIGRLAPGVTAAQAQTQLDNLAADLRSQFEIKESSGLHFRAEPMHADLVAYVRTEVLALMGAVVFVLLIACANVANLLLVRGAKQERELAVKATLGATRGRLIGQVMAESFVVAAAGALFGLLVAWAGIRLLRLLRPENLPRLDAVSIDFVVLAWAALAGLVSAIVFGLVPALRASRVDVADVLRASGRTAALGGGRRLRSAVVVAEVALSFVLLVGSGLMIRSFIALNRIDPGYDPDGLLTFNVGLNAPRYADVDAREAFQRQMHARLSALPGVTATTAAFPLPLDGTIVNSRWGTEAAVTDPSAFQQANLHIVMPGYFDAMRGRLLAGRVFTQVDNTPESHAIIIDDVLAAKAFPGEQAVGKRLFVRSRGNEPEFLEVIGVVAHQRHTSLREVGRETIFVTDGFLGHGRSTRWALRTSGDPARLAASARAVVAELDPNLAVDEMQPMSDYVRRASAQTRFALVLIGAFAVVAGVLAVIGLYSVLATVVRQRTAEIGVRLAFGAPRTGIFKLVVGQGLMLGAAGVGIGLVAALAITRVMRSLLVGVQPTDLLTYVAMAAGFFVVAAAACWVPAWRAAALDPNAALREE